MTSLLSAIAAVSTLVGGLIYLIKYTSWLTVKTPEAKREDIAKANAEAQAKAEETGRPQ